MLGVLARAMQRRVIPPSLLLPALGYLFVGFLTISGLPQFGDNLENYLVFLVDFSFSQPRGDVTLLNSHTDFKRMYLTVANVGRLKNRKLMLNTRDSIRIVPYALLNSYAVL